MAAAFDLDGPATVVVPRSPGLAISISAEDDQLPFPALRAAVKFVMEEMSEDERANCLVVTATGPLKGEAQFAELYRIIAMGEE